MLSSTGSATRIFMGPWYRHGSRKATALPPARAGWHCSAAVLREYGRADDVEGLRAPARIRNTKGHWRRARALNPAVLVGEFNDSLGGRGSGRRGGLVWKRRSSAFLPGSEPD